MILKITASDKKYKEILDHTFSHYDRIYDLGGCSEPFYATYTWPKKPRDHREIRRWKPRYMLHASADFQKPIVWLDADSMLVAPLHEMEEPDYDVALVVRKKEGKIKFKSATVFIQPTKEAHLFLRRWMGAIPDDGRGDQIFLREMISKYYPLTVETYEKHRILTIGQARVKLLDRSTYCWEIKRVDLIDQVPSWAKVVHFSGWSGSKKHQQKMNIFREYIRRA